MIAIPIEMPKNCHDCNALGISDIVGLTGCAGIYDFDKRPEKCPLREICTLSCKKSIDRYECLDLTKEERQVLVLDGVMKDVYTSIMNGIAKENNVITVYETKEADPDYCDLRFEISIVRSENDTEGAASRFGRY